MTRIEAQLPSRHGRRITKLRLASQAVVLAAILNASSIASTSAIAIGQAHQVEVEPILIKRHGDHEHEEEEHSTMATVSSSQASNYSTAQHHSTMEATGAHPHGHDGHSHEHAVYAMIPDPLAQTIETFIAIPARPAEAGGHSHGGHGEPKLELNETVIVQSKGPDPLSYIEWDFAYGIGKSNDLLRFSSATQESGHVMGVGGSRWRTLVDEKDESIRTAIASDIKQRVQQNAEEPGRHRTLLVLHVLGCIVSCFVLLPIALALRSSESNLASLASLVYLAALMTSLFMSQLYKAMTPQLYPSNSHSGLGYAIFWISLITLGGDVLKLLKQIFTTFTGMRRSSKKVTLKTFMQAISLRQSSKEDTYDALEEERMLSPQDGESDAQEITNKRDHSADSSSQGSSHRVHFAQEQPLQNTGIPHRLWSAASSSRQNSTDLPSPTSTLCNTPRTSLLGERGHHQSPSMLTWKLPHSTKQERVTSWRRFDDSHQDDRVKVKKRLTGFQRLLSIFRLCHVIVARSIPILSFAAAYTGLAVYTGSCRGPYKNVCLAHGIKGGIFFWYGLFSFARYLGAYADLGWAWNRSPSSKKRASTAVSAEWVESFVIFFYGATNTWMERFGAKHGDPYSVKQVQHISIAVMFWFAGLMGMILETKSFKNLLALPVALKQSAIDQESTGRNTGMTCDEAVALPSRPPSYNFSFNPFPALVIGVTGVAMAAHHQDYIYEVSIHSLWGNLLAGFSIFRILTYFFLWLRPPTSSIMPSRPPTEALASFCLASGGLVFMLSSEEVSFVAMRNGFGDFMMILNLTVAIISFLFCSIAGLMILKAFAVRREKLRQDSSIQLEDVQSNTVEPQFEPVFVLGDEEESQDEKRKMSRSPSAI